MQNPEMTEQRAQCKARFDIVESTEVDERQGLSDVGSPLGHVILTQVHILLAVVRLQAFHLLLVLVPVHQPPCLRF